MDTAQGTGFLTCVFTMMISCRLAPMELTIESIEIVLLVAALVAMLSQRVRLHVLPPRSTAATKSEELADRL